MLFQALCIISINPTLGSSQITMAETRLVLENIDVTKASSPDNISGRILKECAIEISPSSTKPFNVSLSLGNVPESWKLANVSPIFKKRDKENCSNYRPIFLLCIASKVLESAVLNQLKSEILPLITQFQHGFLGGRSTETQLLHVYNYINSILDSSGQADIIYLDFSKAFDSVPIISCCVNYDRLVSMVPCASGLAVTPLVVKTACCHRWWIFRLAQCHIRSTTRSYIRSCPISPLHKWSPMLRVQKHQCHIIRRWCQNI